MTTLAEKLPTLKDVVNSKSEFGAIVEIMNETNEILDDMVVVEANDGSNNKTEVRTGLPEGVWRKLNYGVVADTDTTKVIKDACGSLSALSKCDVKLAQISGNPNGFRLKRSQAQLEGMAQGMASAVFYGNSDKDPEKIMGLSPRYNASSTDNTKTGYNVIKGGGAGSDNTSMWIIGWAPDTIFSFYPTGSKAGLTRMKEEARIADDGTSRGAEMPQYKDFYEWDIGLTVADWRYAVRICNIDTSELADAGESGFDGASLVNLLIEGVNKIPNLRKGRLAIYANNTVKTALDKIANNSSNLNLQYSTDVGGKPIATFRGIPIRRCDALLNTESTVS